ncbi:MAG: tetratricopeptide repeat protein [Methanoregula sp.]|jgi:tetratricopeptide (TPR) repeat protein|uniref:tetratricopeptide repeat protein n=1 Tax=Methanoregula sp. TaxID=2052170 RepID=UPI0025DFABCC|nr:tetratricopeptide repeat protein [Methanoregula sp.]MCK9630348.1 tetratricopeptide repeat protein [Methanoregula sp.]
MHFKSIVLFMVVGLLLISPVLAADDADQSENPWYWYNKAVDLAYAGQFTEALQANEKALALNQSFPLAWANEAGILVQLGRYDDAIKAADMVLSVNSTYLPNTYAAAYYSKGDALRLLGKTSEAKAAYAKASELDPTLVAPDMPSGTVPSGVPSLSSTPSAPPASEPVQATPSATRTPLSLAVAIGAVMIAFVWCRQGRRP